MIVNKGKCNQKARHLPGFQITDYRSRITDYG